MNKTAKLIGVSVILFFCGGLYLYAQRPASTSPGFDNPDSIILAQKIDAVAGEVHKIKMDAIQAKLDQIANTQQKILDELAIVKVRATRR